MLDLVIAVLLILGFLTLLTVGGTWAAVAKLQRRNRVSPSQRAPVPTMWLWSPALAARLHRRLRASVTVAGMAAARDPQGETGALARDLEKAALATDARLADVGRLSLASRRQALPALAGEVDRVEWLAMRLSALSTSAAEPVRLPGEPTAIEQLANRLDHLEAARDEVRAVERRAGLEPPAPRKPPKARGGPSSKADVEPGGPRALPG
jgi:hypothetical protein